MQAKKVQEYSPPKNVGRCEKSCFVDVQLMHLRIALKNDALSKSDPESIIRVAANLLAGRAATKRQTPNIDDVHRFARRYSINISSERITCIAEEEFSDSYLTSEGIGKLLKLTAEDQERFGLWTLGVHGETAEDQKARTQARQVRRKAKEAAKRAAARGPYWVNIAATSRETGLSEPTLRRLRDEWIAGSERGDFVVNFSDFVASRIDTKNTYLIGGKRWKMSALMKKLNRSERTIQRYLNEPGKIETKLGLSKSAQCDRRPPNKGAPDVTQAQTNSVNHSERDIASRPDGLATSPSDYTSIVPELIKFRAISLRVISRKTELEIVRAVSELRKPFPASISICRPRIAASKK